MLVILTLSDPYNKTVFNTVLVVSYLNSVPYFLGFSVRYWQLKLTDMPSGGIK